MAKAPTIVTEPGEESAGPFRFEGLPAVACVEVDRFCEGCGYNLRTQAVRSEPRTRILVVRCPECGRYHSATDSTSAGRPWLRRLGLLLLFCWGAVIVYGLAMVLIGQGAVVYHTLYALTTHRQIETVKSFPDGSMSIRIANAALEPVTDGGRYALTVLAAAAASFGLGFVAASIVVVVFHHWSRRSYLWLALTGPTLVAGVVFVAWWYEARHLFTWGLPHVVGQALVQSLGGIAGIFLGRPLVRLIVRALFPPGLRSPLAFLWLTDGLGPPKMVDLAGQPPAPPGRPAEPLGPPSAGPSPASVRRSGVPARQAR